MPVRDAVIVGGGHNGLIAAAVLAKAGLKPLVLERRPWIGGCAITAEIAPGFRCPTLAHRAAIDPAIVRALGLEHHGLQIIRPDALACAPTGEGRALTLWADTTEAARDIAAFSGRDAERYPAFLASIAAVSAVLRRLTKPAPLSGGLTAADVLELLIAGRSFRALRKADAYRLLRWLPMPVADLTGEWFESEPLRATIAAGGLLASFVGPRSPGSAAVLLWLAAGEGHPVASGWTAAGGVGAISEALASAARRSGAEIRVGAGVQQIVIQDGAAAGVVLSTGEQITARCVVSNADPRRTMLGLVDPVHLPPEYRQAVHDIRMRGTLATVSYAVSSLPAFSDFAAWEPARRARALSGCIRLCQDTDAIERAFDAAKYGRYAEDPWIQLTIPSLADPSLAPAGCHVVSAHVLFAPYHLRDTSWDLERERLGDIVTRAIAKYAPGFEQQIVARSVVTPFDLERDHGLTGGQVFHGELALDQLLMARPVFGWARHRTPIPNLFLCGTGTHPGAGFDGRSGALAAREILRSRS
jgi:phytoene dehydrogenase-like protein